LLNKFVITITGLPTHLPPKSGTLENAAEALKGLAVENGAPEGIEVIQTREFGNTVLFGIPGTLLRMKAGTFPPLTPPDDSVSP
jgi:hypothetical protein